MMEFQDLWNKTLEILSSNLAESTFSETFSEVKHVMKEENGVIYVLAPSTFIRSKIVQLYGLQIDNILKSISSSSKKLKFKFVCENQLEKPKAPLFPRITKNNLNENNTFESFVVGDSNKLAYFTALKVAENPGTLYNPLYIFGGVGLGKTHLMQAIGNSIYESDLNNNVLYVQATDYLEDYGKATRDNNLRAFEEKYDNLDVLLVDDIQMLEKGKSSQQEFFKLFNNMITRQKQIVITSDCPAAKLNGIMERLTSRFQMGMTVDIKQPDFNQRMNILRRKLAETSEISLNDDILSYIAENFIDNVRELEGALNRVLWVSQVYNTNPTLDIAIEALDILIKAKKPNENYENALSVIANMYNVSIADILGTSRSSKYVLPRHIAMYVLKNHYKLKYSKIGSIFNGKDHTTIMNGCKKIEAEIKTNKELQMAIDSVIKKV